MGQWGEILNPTNAFLAWYVTVWGLHRLIGIVSGPSMIGFYSLLFWGIFLSMGWIIERSLPKELHERAMILFLASPLAYTLAAIFLPNVDTLVILGMMAGWVAPSIGWAWVAGLWLGLTHAQMGWMAWILWIVVSFRRDYRMAGVGIGLVSGWILVALWLHAQGVPLSGRWTFLQTHHEVVWTTLWDTFPYWLYGLLGPLWGIIPFLVRDPLLRWRVGVVVGGMMLLAMVVLDRTRVPVVASFWAWMEILWTRRQSFALIPRWVYVAIGCLWVVYPYVWVWEGRVYHPWGFP